MKYLVLLGVEVLFVAAYLLVYQIATVRLLNKHQREWDEIKSHTPECDVDATYMRYLEYLMQHRHPWLGYCFPRR